MTAVFSRTLPSAGDIIEALQREGILIWIDGCGIDYRIPKNKRTYRFQIEGAQKIIYDYLAEQREERAGILMDSGADYKTATLTAENQMRRQAILAAFPEMEKAILEMEDNGITPQTLTLPNGDIVWNSIK